MTRKKQKTRAGRAQRATRDARGARGGQTGLAGLAAFNWQLWGLVAITGLAVIVVLIFLAGPVVRNMLLERNPNEDRTYTAPEIILTIASMTATPNPDVPDGLEISPPPGSAIPLNQSACVTVIFLTCDNGVAPPGQAEDSRHCYTRSRVYVDSSPVDANISQVFDVIQGQNGEPDKPLSKELVCMDYMPALGTHLYQIQAYPGGKYVWYSWLWTVVEPTAQ